MSTGALSNRQVIRLLESWGFQEVRSSGGQVMFKHPEHAGVVSTIAEGRNAHCGDAPLRTAGRIMGKTLAEIKAGPPKREKRRPVLQYDQPARPLPYQNEKVDLPPIPLAEPEAAGPKGPEEPERLQNGVRILEYLQGRPAWPTRVQQIGHALGLTTPQVSASLRSLQKRHPVRPVVRDGRRLHGVWEFCPPNAKIVLPVLGTLHGDCFEKVGMDTAADGRVILRSPQGQLFVAVPVVAPSIVQPTFDPEEGWQDREPDTDYVGATPTKVIKPVNQVSKPGSVQKASPAKRAELEQKRQAKKELVGVR